MEVYVYILLKLLRKNIKKFNYMYFLFVEKYCKEFFLIILFVILVKKIKSIIISIIKMKNFMINYSIVYIVFMRR